MENHKHDWKVSLLLRGNKKFSPTGNSVPVIVPRVENCGPLESVIASVAKQSQLGRIGDCFVVSLLAMTWAKHAVFENPVAVHRESQGAGL